MGADEPQFLQVGEGGKRRIAYRLADAAGSGPALLWLPGFLSDMASTKVLALAEWARGQGVPMLRFDYSGHGQSGGNLLEASIGDWLEEASATLDLLGANRRVILVGSSMGGWIALLLARRLARKSSVKACISSLRFTARLTPSPSISSRRAARISLARVCSISTCRCAFCKACATQR